MFNYNYAGTKQGGKETTIIMKSLDDINQYLEEQFEIGNFGRVLKNANIILKSDREDLHCRAFFVKAIALLSEGTDEEVLQAFDDGLSRFPDDYALRSSKARALLNIGEFDIARTELRNLHESNPKDIDILSNLIYTEEIFKNYDEVIRLADLILAEEANSISTIVVKGEAYEKSGNYEKALQTYEDATSIEELDDQDLNQIHHCIGNTYCVLEKFEEAIDHYKTALIHNSEDTYTYHSIGLAFAKTGEIEKAVKLINHAIKLDPRNSYAYKNRAIVQIMENNTEEAIQDLKTAKMLNYVYDYDDHVDLLLQEIQEKDA